MASYFLILLVVAFSLTSAYGAIVGKYDFVSQENYEEFLAAIKVDSTKIEKVAAFQPNIIIVKEGDEYVVTHVTPTNSFNFSFVPGQAKKMDIFGSGDPAEYVTEVEGDDTFLTKKVSDPTIQIVRKFDESGTISTFKAGEVTATRSYKRVE